MEELKSGSPPCGIYITILDFSDMPQLIRDIRQFTFAVNQTSKYEKNMNIVELSLPKTEPTALPEFIGLLQQQGMVVVLSGHVDEKDLKGADGVFLNDIEGRAEEDKITGIEINNKAAAEKAISAKIDYCKLPADKELIAWWASKTETPCCVVSKNITPENCAALANAGATFIDATTYIMSYKKGVIQATTNILHALNQAAEAKPTVN